MSYKTVEVELENGHVRPSGPEELPPRAHALLTLLDTVQPQAPALTCGELADRWMALIKLSPDEGSAFASDIEKARASLPPLKPAWD